jgi:hypothetical protein
MIFITCDISIFTLYFTFILALRYYYPARLLGWELTTVFLYVFVNYTRLILLSRGNKTAAFSSLAYSIVFSIPILTLHAYYIDLQTYVLRADIVINSVALAVTSMEVIMSSYMLYSMHVKSY